MNNMEKVAEILGVKLGERFEITEKCFGLPPLRLTVDGIVDDKGVKRYGDYLVGIIAGRLNIEKLPWKPKIDDRYWFVKMDGNVDYYYWRGASFGYALYYAGNCFETREEAAARAPEIIEKLRKKYEEG